MTRRGFHILLALILVGCVLSPYVELATGWGQSICDTGYDTESTVAIIALLLIAKATLLRAGAWFPDLPTHDRWVRSRLDLLVCSDAFERQCPSLLPPFALRSGPKDEYLRRFATFATSMLWLSIASRVIPRVQARSAIETKSNFERHSNTSIINTLNRDFH